MVPAAERHDQYAHRILSEIDGGRPISQRSLANSLGIALGMTNLLLRRLVRRGLVRVSRVRPNRVAYFLTPAGVAEKARMSRDIFQRSIQLYASARDRIRAHFELLSEQWPGPDAADKPVVFLGTGEVAEIAYLCLHETDLHLVGAIDFQGRTRFFGVPVFPASALDDGLRVSLLDGQVQLIAFADNAQSARFLADLGLDHERVRWI